MKSKLYLENLLNELTFPIKIYLQHQNVLRVVQNRYPKIFLLFNFPETLKFGSMN